MTSAPGLPVDEATRLLRHYTIACGVNSFLIDLEGNVLFSADERKSGCSFCNRLEGILGSNMGCRDAHRYGSYQAERFGGSYIYFCPVGLTHWASPIITDGMLRGAVLGGPVLMIDREEFITEDIIRAHAVDPLLHEELVRLSLTIPLVSPDRVTSLCEMLLLASTFLSDLTPAEYLEERELMTHQSSVSQYIHHLKTMGGGADTASEYPVEKEKELIAQISIGDRAGANRVLNELIGHIFFSTGGEFTVIKARVLELIVVLSRAALEGGADVEQIFGLNFRYLDQIHGFTTVEDLTFWLSRIMNRFSDCVFNLTEVKHVDVMWKARDYIRRNFREKITLTDVAAHVRLSPSYFSRLFKEEMKSSFNSYLNRMRIEAGKKLLTEDSVPLIEIAFLVGYEDQSYFTKVFKNMTGMSPGRYRESRGKGKHETAHTV